MAPRSRNTDNAWLKDYPGLHIFPDGRFYVIHPETKVKASLSTRDKQTALSLYALLKAKWEPGRIEAAAQALLNRLESMGVPKGESDNMLFCDYAKYWREDILGFLVAEDGKVTRLPTKVIMKNGSAIADRTQTDYGRQCRQLEQSEKARFRLADRDALKKTRQLLSPWSNSPEHYNHLLAVVNHIYKSAIRDGILDRNPATDIEKLGTRKREVYIDDQPYIKITTALMKHIHNGKEEDGEWRARICDLLYMVSSRPGDYFRIKDSMLRLPEVDWEKPGDPTRPEEEPDYGSITFGVSKTKVGQIIDMNREMRLLVDWFLAFKRQHRIFNKSSLFCYPPYMGKVAGKPVSHRFMGDSFAEAVVAAGYPKGAYRLVDLRKRGLTDEFVSQGENDKGSHKSQAMRNYYRLIQPPKRARNTLVDIRKVGAK